MRVWEIREGHGSHESYRHGNMSEEEREMYECGYEDGFGAAMRKVEKEKYGSRMGYREEMRYPRMDYRMGYRDEDDDDDDRMGERRYRRRDSRGRYM